ncbi:efflux RND transporter periplasmic adaptor subunit [Arenimonas donghaensis]|uniref:efflux RND transporter periplasmic adaptor subunit n=1 Tax=Arenimonas donghaensis TaxID=375061 RepID=UPI0005556B9E|nr:efflux RND transporter periplasmic adaptor subunit [Arenimonas donghaensis]
MKLTAVSRRTLGLIAVAIPIVVLFIYVVVRSGPMAPVSVTTASVTMRELKPQIAGVGTVDARYTHRVGPITPGRLLLVDVQPGDTVEAGQVLAELDPVDLEQRLDALRAAAERAEATLSELEARHAFAASQAERYEKLFTAQVVSEEQIITKRQELRIAESALNAGHKEIARTRADVRAAESQRDSLVLRAPVNGIVAARTADPGTTVVAGQPVIEVIEPGEVWLNARFDQVSAHGLAAGLPAVIELRSREGELFNGEVVRVEPKADPVTEETVAKLAFAEKVEPLPPLGEIVHLTVHLPVRKAALAIPSAALRRVDHAIGVWKVVDGDIEFTPVRTGPTDLHGYVQVHDGLQVGDVVVLYSETTLAARTRIREVEALPGAAP